MKTDADDAPTLLERHPLSALWGDMPEDEYVELVESIRRDGVLDYVLKTLDDQVLDGWHRYRAAHDAGVPHQLLITEYTGDDPAGFVVKRNAHRRHLTAGQRAQMIVGCREWAKGGVDTDRLMGGEPGAPPPATVAEMAEEAGVSERTIQQAKVAEEAGLGDAVRAGELSTKAAAQRAKGEPDAPKPPTRAQRLEAERDVLALDVQEKATRIDELEDETTFHRGNMDEQEAERHKAYTALQSELSAARSQINEWMVKYNEELRSRKYWEREAKRLGWAPSNGEKI